ncbi:MULTISPECIES: HlyD family efflux transporter periplasmic adaptor subunit [Methylobacterium]|uniref:Colicin V secretion protein CvaA n=1 Tax=Methylobacterium bullatum TaxID=570505 RepID=A0A679JZ37_9HYPH|nr:MULTISPECIES: HlyD family efflux transporter periplasmic adaptor subunit [Methylobacterium]MBD8903107.1 secretion protein HlyD [Methylobacterium bullatum]TXN28469.1 HlyD family efflux transporter periplasmic adaptor subunit [Methylobacterium sp. WL19]GJD40187.1 Colicin V secretion protein CvaA [Methylobacterium bullatum]CAA2137270.1 Colicin V secretion protein CvaA [Methylobacterium bullatum]
MTSPLFRAEVARARQDSWLGEAQIVQPLSIRLMTAITILITIAAILYVVFGTYTRRIHAFGMLTPDVGLITVASPVAGRVSASGVKEGDRVVQGQLLYTLDLDAVSANGPTQQRIIDQLARQKETIEAQSRLRSAMAATEKRSLAEQIDNLQSQSRQLEEQVQLQEKLVPPLKERVDVLAKAVSDGFARSADLQNQNYLYLQASSQLAQFRNSRLQLMGKVGELQATLATFDDKLARDLAEMDRTAAQLEQQRAESEARRAIEVRAPEKGILTSIRVQAGQGVAAGATLLTLLPSEGRLQANLFVESSAIGFIDTGEAVMLRYAAFPFQRFGLYRGTVSEVTRAPLEAADLPEAAGAKAKNGDGIYRIIVRPDENSVIAYGESRRLEAGMRVEADIALEKRPLYRWLLDPLYRVKRSVDLVTRGG